MACSYICLWRSPALSFFSELDSYNFLHSSQFFQSPPSFLILLQDNRILMLITFHLYTCTLFVYMWLNVGFLLHLPFSCISLFLSALVAQDLPNLVSTSGSNFQRVYLQKTFFAKIIFIYLFILSKTSQTLQENLANSLMGNA